MLVLLSFALVLLAAVLLLVGLAVDSGLALIYASIGCSLAAGVLLILATRAQRGGSMSGRPAHDAEAVTWGRRVGPVPSGDEDYLFPIGQYEQRPVAEILPLLSHLYEDELDLVEARERRGAGREVILGRVDELRRRFRAAPTQGAGRRAGAEKGPADLPIPGYAALRVPEVTAALSALSVAELDQVRAYEERSDRRRAVLEAIDRRRATLVESGDATPSEPPPEPEAR